MEPRIGVAVFILDENERIILGLRKGVHGEGTWATPGGHLEFGESFEVCAEREVLEETGLQVHDFKFLGATNDIMKAEGKHYVTIHIACRIKGEKRQPELLEPGKCERWEWVTWEDIQTWGSNEPMVLGMPTGRQLFLPIRNLLLQRLSLNIMSWR